MKRASNLLPAAILILLSLGLSACSRDQAGPSEPDGSTAAQASAQPPRRRLVLLDDSAVTAQEQPWWQMSTSSPRTTPPKVQHVELNLSGDVLFEPNSAVLTAGASSQLSVVLANYLSPLAGARLKITGHTDYPDPGPVPLSQRRSAAVKRWFVLHGVPQGSVEAVGVGNLHPLYPNDSARRLAANRRCEITVVRS